MSNQNQLQVELPQGYEAFADYERHDEMVSVEVQWQGKTLASGWIIVAMLSVAYYEPDLGSAYANAREFARRCATIHTTIREHLGDNGLHDADSGMALAWTYTAEDDEDLLEVEVRQHGTLVLQQSCPMPPAMRDFDDAPEDVVTHCLAGAQHSVFQQKLTQPAAPQSAVFSSRECAQPPWGTLPRRGGVPLFLSLNNGEHRELQSFYRNPC